MFLGDDWKNIRHYREFEIAPSGDSIKNIAIDLDKNSYEPENVAVGSATQGSIDEATQTWYAAGRRFR